MCGNDRVFLCALALTGAVAGCASLGDLTGAVAAIASGTFTHDPAIGLSVGITVKTATDEAGKVISRKRQQAEQDAIAAIAGNMNPGESRPWEVKHTLPPRSTRGEVRVIRVIETPLALCKELLFSVVRGREPGLSRSWFTSTACRQDDRWKWAAAEPAVDRWGSLQ